MAIGFRKLCGLSGIYKCHSREDWEILLHLRWEYHQLGTLDKS